MQIQSTDLSPFGPSSVRNQNSLRPAVSSAGPENTARIPDHRGSLMRDPMIKYIDDTQSVSNELKKQVLFFCFQMDLRAKGGQFS